MRHSLRFREPAVLRQPVHQLLNKYVLAASGAAVGILSLTQSAEAKIVYTPANIKLPQGVYPLDLNHDGINDFSFYYSVYANGKSSLWQENVKNAAAGKGIVGYGRPRFASALPAGIHVGPKRAFGSFGIMAGYFTYAYGSKREHSFFGPWANKGKGVKNRYLGVEFLVKNKLHYGWVRLNVAMQKTKVEATITGYAYETVANKPIITGKTKGPDLITEQPGTLGRLALGRK